MRKLIVLLAFSVGACASDPVGSTQLQPQTVSVQANATSDAEAQRLCGGDARPETVHHETNVITYRCLRGAS